MTAMTGWTCEEALAVRTIMFVPVLAEAYIEKAHTRGADAIIVDLEDSIPPDSKGKGRDALASAIDRIAPHAPVFVRVNNTPEHLDADLRAAVRAGLTGILLPKSETVDEVCRVARTVATLAEAAGVTQTLALALLVETPAGIANVATLADADPTVVALVFGSEDYSAILGVRPTPAAMTVPAQLLSIAARGRGLAAWGVAGTIVEIADSALLAQVASDSKQLGFTGTIAVNPKQIPICNDAFGLSDADIAWATDVVRIFDEAVKTGRAAVAHQGRMIDTPVAVRAERILDRARRQRSAGGSRA